PPGRRRVCVLVIRCLFKVIVRLHTMTDQLILAIDQGTTNTKAIVIDKAGRVLARASTPMKIMFPHPAWVEQDPVAIWESVVQVIDECLAKISPAQPSVIGISNQRETILAWDS